MLRRLALVTRPHTAPTTVRHEARVSNCFSCDAMITREPCTLLVCKQVRRTHSSSPHCRCTRQTRREHRTGRRPSRRCPPGITTRLWPLMLVACIRQSTVSGIFARKDLRLTEGANLNNSIKPFLAQAKQTRPRLADPQTANGCRRVDVSRTLRRCVLPSRAA